jgi:dolichol kinase
MSGAALRRLLHAASGGVLVVVPLGSWEVFRTVMVVGAGAAVALETVRLSSPRFRDAVARTLPVFRPREQGRPSGAMWLSVGYALAALVPAPAPAAGILVAALADPAASLVGTWRRTPGSKTWRGSVAHAITAAAVLAVLGWTPGAVLVGAAVATLLERAATGVDDNLVVAPATAIAVLLVA